MKSEIKNSLTNILGKAIDFFLPSSKSYDLGKESSNPSEKNYCEMMIRQAGEKQ